MEIITFLLSVLALLWGTVDNTVSEHMSTTTDPVLAEVVRVIDGDTIAVSIDGVQETVRYIGIDTPEPYRDGEPACFSQEASDRNKQLVANQWVTLVADVENRDRYDRLLRYVYVDDVFVNEVLVADGYATALYIKPNVAKATQFSQLEDEAQAAGRGLWTACVKR